MKCVKPKTAYVLTGKKTTAGKKVLVFSKPIKNTPYEQILIDCGWCIKCRLGKAGDLANRATHEAKYHNRNCFITLTYSDENLPYGGTLVKQHHQKFIRSIRDKISPIKVRYMLCGEYGDKFGRAHYHIILFGYDFPDKKHYNNGDEFQYYTSEIADKAWNKGTVQITDISPDTMSYVAGYTVKKISGSMANEPNPITGLKHYETMVEETGEVIEKIPEYGAMSLKPGLGKSYFDQYKSDIYPSDFVVRKGQQMAVPKYYDQLLEKTDPDLYDEIKAKRIKTAESLTKLDDNTHNRRKARETVALAKRSLKPRG